MRWIFATTILAKIARKWRTVSAKLTSFFLDSPGLGDNWTRRPVYRGEIDSIPVEKREGEFKKRLKGREK
jgi:hypothetical protein